MPRLTALLLAALLPFPALADTIACSITYGGETRVFTAQPTAAPYGVAAVPIGSYFLFRLVVEADPAAAKVYVYGDREGGPVPLHQATHPMPVEVDSPYGFTGLNFVYEPVRDGELQYWCRALADEEVKS